MTHSATSGQKGWRYATGAIVLPWLIAAAILTQVMLPSRMEAHTPQAFAITQLHKSIGISILLLSLIRLAWRLTHRPAPLPATIPRWERVLATLVHVGFYVIMIGMPLTGWLMVSASRTAIPTLLFGVVPWPNLPGLAGLAPAAKTVWREIGEDSHNILAKVIWVLLGLHVAGALKHQWLSRDEPVLNRMAPGAVPGRWAEPRLLVIALGAAGAVALGLWITPPLPRSAPLSSPAVGEANPPAAQMSLAASPAASPAPTPAPPAASAAPSGPAVWRVAPGSTLAFATSWSGQAIEGRFDSWRADILFSPEALDRSKVSVTIDLGSVKSGDDQRDASLGSADWFDTANHPKASYVATKFQKTGADSYVAHGVLDLRGVKKPLDLPFKLTITGDTARVSGTASLDRLVFGVGQGEWRATDAVPAKVMVRIKLTARRAP